MQVPWSQIRTTLVKPHCPPTTDNDDAEEDDEDDSSNSSESQTNKNKPKAKPGKKQSPSQANSNSKVNSAVTTNFSSSRSKRKGFLRRNPQQVPNEKIGILKERLKRGKAKLYECFNLARDKNKRIVNYCIGCNREVTCTGSDGKELGLHLEKYHPGMLQYFPGYVPTFYG
jgi:hypothetical protein